MTEAEQRVIDGTTWDNFCDALKAAGKIIQSEKAPKDAFNQAEGYRYLARLLRGGLESFLEFRDPMFPQLRCGAHETIKLGADNPDNRYESASINPQYDYRIYGKRGTVDYLGISSIINKYASGGTMEVTGHIDHRQMEIGDNGDIEIILSRTEKPGNWLPMGDDTNSITVRQTFQDRINEKIIQLLIEENQFEGIVEIGLQFKVGSKGDRLSGGQRQKIAIARALLKKPKILIMDEATSALDNNSQTRIQRHLDTRLKGKTTLIAVIHRLDIIKNYDKIGVMKSGKIEEMGTYGELMDKKSLLYELATGRKT